MRSSFFKHVDDIVRTIRVDPTVVFEAANILHSNLHFTLEEFGITCKFGFKSNFGLLKIGHMRLESKTLLIPGPFLVLEAAHFCSGKEV